jgi:hypothetical protein
MAALAAVGAARLIAPPSLPLSRLHCPAERLELGTVWESDSLEVRLPLTNQGDGAVKIADFVNSCSCTQITPRQLVLEPGETREIQVRLDLRSSKRPKPPVTERFEIMLQPRDESGRTLADLKPWIATPIARHPGMWSNKRSRKSASNRARFASTFATAMAARPYAKWL